MALGRFAAPPAGGGGVPGAASGVGARGELGEGGTAALRLLRWAPSSRAVPPVLGAAGGVSAGSKVW